MEGSDVFRLYELVFKDGFGYVVGWGWLGIFLEVQFIKYMKIIGIDKSGKWLSLEKIYGREMIFIVYYCRIFQIEKRGSLVLSILKIK